MTWIEYTTLGVSVGTLIYLIISSFMSFRNDKKLRRITVFLEERRKMHNELFNHITSVLDIGRKCQEVEGHINRQGMKWKLLNHKIFIWINLNKDNEFGNELRSKCNEYIFWCAGVLEQDINNQKYNYEDAADENAQHIWVLIDKYVEKENELREKMI